MKQEKKLVITTTTQQVQQFLNKCLQEKEDLLKAVADKEVQITELKELLTRL